MKAKGSRGGGGGIIVLTPLEGKKYLLTTVFVSLPVGNKVNVLL